MKTKNISYLIGKPMKYYEGWKQRNPHKKILSVSEYCVYINNRMKMNHETFKSLKGYNHIKGILFKKGFKKVKQKRIPIYKEDIEMKGGIGRIKKGVILKNRKPIIKEWDFKYVVLKDERYDDTLVFVVEGGEIGELLYNEAKGEKIIVFFVHKSRGGYLSPYYYHYCIDENELTNNRILDKLKRQEHRLRTFYLYPLIYKRDNYRCIKCLRKKDLTIHHRNYNENNTEEENLESMMVLCRKCHYGISKEQIKANKFITLDNF